jgi:hypothetical protein
MDDIPETTPPPDNADPQSPAAPLPPDEVPDADGVTTAMREANKGVDYRRPRCRDEKWFLARGYKIPHRRHQGLDIGTMEHLIHAEPEPALEATGCPDPFTAGEFLERIGNAMPGVFVSGEPRDPNVKTRVEVYNRAAIHGAAIHNGTATSGVIAQNLVLAESWALHLFKSVGEFRHGPDAAQERAMRLAAKFIDLVSRQAEVLDRLKNGARQTVRVERVVVEPGGQAVVGVVQAARGRDGGTPQ